MIFKKLMLLFCTALLVLLVLPANVLGAYWVLGTVYNHSDGTDANNYNITVYITGTPADNITDYIGPRSAQSPPKNEYMIDCTTLSTACEAGDNVTAVITSTGDAYYTDAVTINLSGEGADEMPDMTLNSTNSAPTMPVPTINSSDGTNLTTQNLNCYAIINDTDNNSMNVSVRWYLDGSLNLTVHYNNTYANGTGFNATLGSGNTSKNQAWNCSMRLFDGTAFSAWGNSTNLTINNSPPTINSNASAPSTVTENDNVFIYANVTDVDDDAIVWVNFTVTAPNGTVVLNSENASSYSGDVWNSTTFSSGWVGNWTWSLVAFDGTDTATTSGLFNISAWHTTYGNISGSLGLGTSNSTTLLTWVVTNVSGSNVFVADTESSVTFDELKALSRTTGDSYVGDDFEELDAVLGYTNFSDSINRTYTAGGNPKMTTTFTIYNVPITNVPVINSTNSSRFLSGIMWDTSDDIGGDGEYDSSDNEDVVFVTYVNNSGSQGLYGIYDYELVFPSFLKRFNTSDAISVYYYVGLNP